LAINLCHYATEGNLSKIAAGYCIEKSTKKIVVGTGISIYKVLPYKTTISYCFKHRGRMLKDSYFYRITSFSNCVGSIYG
jgi:hypothetical protein